MGCFVCVGRVKTAMAVWRNKNEKQQQTRGTRQQWLFRFSAVVVVAAGDYDYQATVLLPLTPFGFRVLNRVGKAKSGMSKEELCVCDIRFDLNR